MLSGMSQKLQNLHEGAKVKNWHINNNVLAIMAIIATVEIRGQ